MMAVIRQLKAGWADRQAWLEQARRAGIAFRTLRNS